MQVSTKRRKKLVRPRVPIQVPTAANERWSADFVHDQLANGRRIRILNIVDDFSRVCVAQVVDTSISGHRMVRLLDDLEKNESCPTSSIWTTARRSRARHCFSGVSERSRSALLIQIVTLHSLFIARGTRS